MALFHARCSDCGEVDLRNRDIKLRICVDTEEAAYVFRCPVCGMLEWRPAEIHIVDVMMAAGIPPMEWALPDELRDRHRFDGAAITHDDLIDFHHRMLETPDFVVLAEASLSMS